MMNNIVENIAFVGCNPANHGGARTKDRIKYLVYHYTGNDGDHDEGNAAYFRDNIVKASAHYFVDDDSITQSVGDLTVAWAVGGEKYASCAQTGGGTMHGIVTNSNSISIEMCDTERNGVYNLTEKTMENALALGRLIMARYNIPIENVYRHFDVTGKLCPAYFVDNDKWAAFKARLAETEEEDMSRFNTVAEISENAPWAVETVEKLIGKGAIKGSGKKDLKGRPADMDLSFDMLRLLVMNDRAGAFGE